MKSQVKMNLILHFLQKPPFLISSDGRFQKAVQSTARTVAAKPPLAARMFSAASELGGLCSIIPRAMTLIGGVVGDPLR
jgi:hypothetical protein